MATSDILVRVLLAALLGGLIGLERELRDQAAGFRTHILVSVGSAAFTLSSIYGFQDLASPAAAGAASVDPGRVAAQIVTGVGFLGAGAIIRHGVTVRGLTTAASLWAVASVGLATGLGQFLLAGVTTIVVVASLYLLRYVEEALIYPRVHNRVTVEVRFLERGFGPLTRLVEMLDATHVVILRMSSDPGDDSAGAIHLTLELPRGMSDGQAVRLISDLPDVRSVTRA